MQAANMAAVTSRSACRPQCGQSLSALGEKLGDGNTRPAQAVLAERGGVGAGAMEPPSGGFAFAFRARPPACRD